MLHVCCIDGDTTLLALHPGIYISYSINIQYIGAWQPPVHTWRAFGTGYSLVHFTKYKYYLSLFTLVYCELGYKMYISLYVSRFWWTLTMINNNNNIINSNK